eukprot:3062165-Karenia_brevis.AAC.1
MAKQRFDLLLVQELMRDGEAAEYAKVEGNRSGYHVAMHSSVRTEAGGVSAGVALTSRWQYGLVNTAIADVVSVPPLHRFVFQHWYGFAAGGLCVGSACNRPFILGGDWNMSPEEIEQSGWPAILGAKVVHSGSPTYVSGGQHSQLDFYLVDSSIVGSVVRCYTVEEVSVKKHLVTVLELDGSFKSRK